MYFGQRGLKGGGVLTGEVVDNAESKRRMAEAKASGDHNFYMMEMGPGLIIDARTKCASSQVGRP